MNTSLLIPALLLSLATLLPLPSPAIAATNPPVLDLHGQKLQPNNTYYILPTPHGRGGGGLTLAQRNNTCPFYVSQGKSQNGQPLKFLPVDPKAKFVQTSTDMNIVFSVSTICVQSTSWRLRGPDAGTGRRYVASGGSIGSPGIRTVSNWFKIEKYEKDYKLVFCPNVCKFCKVLCGDLGVFVEDGKRWIGFSDVPIAVVFKKV